MAITAKEMVAYAESFCGYVSVNKSNIFNQWYWGYDAKYDWCMAFIQYIFSHKDMTLPSKIAHVGIPWSGYATKNKGAMDTGDLVVFDWEQDNCRDHIGIFKEWVVEGKTFNAVEGNTAQNGIYTYVKVRTRNLKDVHGYWRPSYAEAEKEEVPTTLFNAIVSDGPLNIRAGHGTNYAVVGSLNNGEEIGVSEIFNAWYRLNDNKGWVWGPYTTKVGDYTLTEFIKEVQGCLHVTQDGIAGKITLGATPTVSRKYNSRHSVVKPIQKRLNELGFKAGEVDGIAGFKFDQAVKAFQRANGCEADGEITRSCKTWKKLLGME